MEINGHVKDAVRGTPYVVVTLCSLIWLMIEGGVIKSQPDRRADPVRVARAFDVLESVDDEGIPMVYWPRRWGSVMSQTNTVLREIAEVNRQQLECLHRIEENSRRDGP